MTTLPLADVKNRLSEVISEVVATHERVTITKNGRPAAVLISADDLAGLEESLEILATPGAIDAITEGLSDLRSGRVADLDSLRARYSS